MLQVNLAKKEAHMKYISRSQWYLSLVKDFLRNPEQNQLSITLYTSEVKRLERQYSGDITIEVGSVVSAGDLRHSCIIKKKDA